MREKITLEKFRELIRPLKLIYKYNNSIYDNNDYNSEMIEFLDILKVEIPLTEEQFNSTNNQNSDYNDYIYSWTKSFIDSLENFQKELLSYDLSDIPYSEWDGSFIILNGDLDLSETKGNFDFDMIELMQNPFVDSKPSLIAKGCNIRNLDKINQKADSYDNNNIHIEKKNFDEKIINENKKAFYIEDLTDNLRSIINKQDYFSIYSLKEKDLFSLSREDIEVLRTHPFFDILIKSATNNNKINGIGAFFNDSVGINIFYDLLLNDKEALNEILNFVPYFPSLFDVLKESNDDINVFLEKTKNNVEYSLFYEIERNIDDDNYREELIERVNNMHKIKSFNFDPLFQNFPPELMEKIKQRNLTIDDFINYSDELNNPFYLLYTKEEGIIKNIKKNQWRNLDDNKHNIEVFFEEFINRCKNVNVIMQNNLKINELYSLIEKPSLGNILTKEEILLGNEQEIYNLSLYLNLSPNSIDTFIQFIKEKENSYNRNSYFLIIDQLLKSIKWENIKIDTKYSDKLVEYINILTNENIQIDKSKLIIHLIINSKFLEETSVEDFKTKIELVSSLNERYSSKINILINSIMNKLDIHNKEELDNFKSILLFLDKMSNYTYLTDAIDFYIDNILNNDMQYKEINKKNEEFEQLLQVLINKGIKISNALEQILNTEIKRSICNKSFDFSNITNYDKIFDIFSKINYSSNNQDSIITHYFKNRFDTELDSNQLNGRDERFILIVNELNKKLQNVSQSTNDVVNDFIIENMNNGVLYSKGFEEKIDYLIDLCIIADYSNSSELRRISSDVIKQLVDFPKEEAYKKFDLIEQVFLKNNLPYFAKLYNVFEILHPNIPSGLSPNLNARKNETNRKIIIFSDILIASIKSNDRNLLDYINNIKEGKEILKLLISGKFNLSDLEKEDMAKEKEIFTIFINHLNTLYNNTLEGKMHPREMKENYIKDAYELLSLFLKTEKENFNVDELPDRIVRMFGHFAGIDTIEQLEKLINENIAKTNERNKLASEKGNITLNKGDLIKGLGSIKFLQNTLKHGVLCKEFLGSAASSDATPMDTDFSIISKESTISEGLDGKAARTYGPIWIILKNDERNRFNNTDTNSSYQKDKLELFNTGVLGSDHVGIRTGLGSSEIDYILIDELYLKDEIEQYIVMNGFYIPIVNFDGKVIFTYEEYEKRRQNMEGLDFYGLGDTYSFASELDDFDTSDYPYDINIGDNIIETTKKRNLIINALSKAGLNISSKRQYDMSNGIFELLDTGSTGRGTNSANDYDFDFIMRIDRDVYLDEDKYQDFQNKIMKAFPGISFIDKYTIRKQHVDLDGQEVEIDITIIQKDDKIQYTTDECIRDRLESLQKLDEDKYKKVLENIVLAKEVLKENECYKPNRGDKPQGGLGGVGVENWILQHGGSFEAAARDFLVKSEGRNFSDFKGVYKVWDFGENHLYYKHSGSKYDEFVSNNMSEAGYERMKKALKKYIEELDEIRNNNSNKQL